MLQFFRQRGLSNVLYGAIILATILTFVIEFRPNASQRTASLTETCVARVRGRCIEPKDFFSAYRMLMPSRSAQVSRRLNLKRVALDGLVERELFVDEAKRLGITVTDNEVTDQLYDGFVRVSVPVADPNVAQAILREMYEAYAHAGLISPDVAQTHFNDRDAAIPVDFRDPKTKAFDIKTYERQVRNLSNRSTVEFREQQSRELLAAKMRDVMRAPVRVSDSETWQEYDRRYSTATVTWIPVKESWAARWVVDPKPVEVDTWVTEHQAEFDRALEERQKQDAPKAGHLRHILVKLPYGASEEEKGAALAKLSWAAGRVKAGEPFAEVARDTSDDPASAANGGDVGDRTDGFVAPFREAADALKPGDTTPGAVETQFGYHLITRDDAAKAPEVAAAVKRSLPRQLLTKERATEAARSVAGRIADRLRDGKSAAEAIDGAIAPYVHPGRTEILRVLPQHPANEPDGGAPPEANADGGGGTSTGAAPPEKATAAKAIGRGKSSASDSAKARSTGSAAGVVAADIKAFDASTDPDRPQTETSTAFNRGGDPFPGLSPEGTRSVVEFAFSAKDGSVMPEPLRMTDGYALVELQQHKSATREDLEKNREALEQDLLRAKRDEALSLYVKRLRAQAKDSVKVDESYVQETRADGGGADDDDEQY